MRTDARRGWPAAVDSTVGSKPAASGSARRILCIERFDRLEGFGRRGAATLYWYAMERLGDVSVRAPTVLDALVEDGQLEADARTTVALVDEFSRAIGNDDAHLGNYGMTFDDEGRASLAPFYDVLPMALAPRHDELPDATLQPVAPSKDPRVVQLVDAFAARLDANAEVSAEFKKLWRRITGR